MTYFTFLLIFVAIPIAVLSVVTIVDYRRGHWLPARFVAIKPWLALLGLCVVALLYTTLWDNYLVASGVWYYDPALINGLVIGWVPIEEYTFFMVQPVLTGLWFFWLMRTMPCASSPVTAPHRVRVVGLVLFGSVWLVSTLLLAGTFVSADLKPLTYLTLELSWALIPVIIQTGFGGHILWRHRTVIAVAIATSTLYLSASDAVAISAGTWAISPQQSLDWLIGGVLPFEEFTFFLLTNVLIVFGLTLVISSESQVRLKQLLQRGWVHRILMRLRPASDASVATTRAETQ